MHEADKMAAFGLTPVRRYVLLALIVAAGAYLRLNSLGWGLPDVFEEATPWRQAWEMWGGATGRLDFNPRFFNYPAFSFYIQWLGQALIYVAGRASGEYSSVRDMVLAFEAGPGRFILVGRFITSLFGIASIYLVYRVGRDFFSEPVGLIAALFLACNFSHIRRGQFIATDVPLMFFVLLAFIPIYMIAAAGGRRHYVWAGICVGLAAGVKYPGFLAAAGLVAAHIYNKVSHNRGWKETVFGPGIWLSAGLALLTFFAVSPYCLIDYSGFLRDFRFEQTHMKIGHFGAAERAVTYHVYLGAIIPAVLTLPIALLSVLGILYGLARRRGISLFLVAFPLAYLAVVGSWKTAADHYVFPALPFLLLFAGLFLQSAFERIPVYRSGLFLTAAACLLVLPSARQIYVFYGGEDAPDNRTVARQWIGENVRPGSGIVKEKYTPDLDPRAHVVFELPLSTLYPESTAPFYDLRWYTDFDYVVVSNEVYLRYRNEPEEYPAHVGFYHDLDAYCELVKVFDDRTGAGPYIKVYRLPEPATGARDGPFPDDMTRAFLEGQDREANARLLVNLGSAHASMRSTARALRLYQMAIGVDPTLSKGWYNLGLMLGNAGQFEECEEAFMRAVEIDSTYTRAWISLGDLYRQTGRPEGAADAYEKALRQEPRRPDILMRLGNLYLSLGNRAAALEYARRAESLGYDASGLLRELE